MHVEERVTSPLLPEQLLFFEVRSKTAMSAHGEKDMALHLEAEILNESAPDSGVVTADSPSVLPSSSSSDPASPAEDPSEPMPAAMEELLSRLDWKGTGGPRGKRVRGTAVEARSKHIEREKQRRSDSAALVAEMDSLVPKGELEPKRSKVGVMRDTVDYVRRMQEVALALIEENRRLSASLAQQPAIVPVGTPTYHPSTPVVAREDIARLFVAGVALTWLSVGTPTPWSSLSSPGTSFTSRHVLSVVSTVAPACAALSSLLSTLFTVFMSLVCIWLVSLFHERKYVSTEKVARVKVLAKEAELAIDRKSNWVLGKSKYSEVLAILDKSMPNSLFSEAVFLSLQLIRVFFYAIRLGQWVERAVISYFERRDATILEARMYMWGARMHPVFGLDWRPVRFYAFLLSAACDLRAADAPAQYVDELHSCLCMFDDMRGSTRGFDRFIYDSFVKLALLQLQPLDIGILPRDTSDWTSSKMIVKSDSLAVMRMTKALSHRRLEDLLDDAMTQVTALREAKQVRAVAIAGLVCFAMRRNDHAFALLSTAVSVGSNLDCMPFYSTRMVSSTLLLCAERLGLRQEARLLLPPLERLITCVPDGAVNILPSERLFLLTARIAMLDEHDYMSLVTHSKQLLGMCESTGVQRIFNMPFAIEVVLERILLALELANTLLLQKPTDRLEQEVYVLHHRAELHDLASTLLQVLSRYANWAEYMGPVIERAVGWYACVSQRLSEAPAHLRRSVIDAKRLGLPQQAEVTIELMKRMQLWMPAIDEKSAPKENV